VEHFHSYLTDNVYDLSLTYDEIIDCISNYHLLFKTMKKYQIANNMSSFGSVFIDDQQNLLLNAIFPDSSAEDIKIQWMYYIINLILYSQIHNDDRYNGEGYKIKRGPSFTIHDLIYERSLSMKNKCPVCKDIIAHSNISIQCDLCPQVYCTSECKQTDLLIQSFTPRHIKKNHCCNLKNKELFFSNIFVNNDLSYTEELPISTRFPTL
jgi:hypothetical protein